MQRLKTDLETEKLRERGKAWEQKGMEFSIQREYLKRKRMCKFYNICSGIWWRGEKGKIRKMKAFAYVCHYYGRFLVHIILYADA